MSMSSSSDDNDDGGAVDLDSARAGRASRAGAKAAKILRIVRMVRLVRLVKLYKYFSENQLKHNSSNGGSSNSSHSSRVAPEDDDTKKKVVDDEDDSSIDNMPPESHVGAAMSDRTTKKVIVGILIMLIGIPLLQVDDLEYVNEFGMQMTFERRAALSDYDEEEFVMDREVYHQLRNDSYNSSSFLGGGGAKESQRDEARDQWKFSERYFLEHTKCVYLRYDGFRDGEDNVATIPDELDRPSRDDLRPMEKVVLTIGGDDDRTMTASFDNSDRTDEEAFLSILLTSFVIVLLALGTLTFSRDVNSLVILPIEKMVQLVREISENPLGKNLSVKPEDMQHMDDGMETTLLLRTISKIAGLMRVGFGEAGAEIIGKNLNMSHDVHQHGGGGPGGGGVGRSSSVSLLGNGTKIQSIFGFCDVRNFTDTTECLQEEVMLFVNRIAHILHSIVVQCDGAANKNIGDAFLLTWKLNPTQLGSCGDHGYAGDKALYSLLKTMAEMSRHEEFLCNFSPTALGALYERMPGYKCRIGCGLHFGWAVEGAIGSEKKIDASYISPHVNMAEFLESSTKEYGVPLLMSEAFHDLLSPQVKKYCRQVDSIQKSKHDDAMGLYTYDADLDVEFFLPVPEAAHHRRSAQLRHRKTVAKPPRASANSRRTVFTQGMSHSSFSESGRLSTLSQQSTRAEPASSRRASTKGMPNEAPKIVLPEFSVDVWENDDDVLRLRMHFSEDHRKAWNDGMEAFIRGDWGEAVAHFNEVLDMTNGNDGPTKNILEKMKEHNFVAPDDWRGYRELHRQ